MSPCTLRISSDESIRPAPQYPQGNLQQPRDYADFLRRMASMCSYSSQRGEPGLRRADAFKGSLTCGFVLMMHLMNH
jgi:hypothetical protein